MIVYEDVKDLKTFLEIIQKHKKVLVGGDGCVQCTVLYAMTKNCIDAYVKLSFEMSEELIDHLFDNSVFGIPFIIVNGQYVYDVDLNYLKKIVCS